MFAHNGSNAASKHLSNVDEKLKNRSVHIDVLHVLPMFSNVYEGTVLLAENYQQMLDSKVKQLKNKIFKINPDLGFKVKQAYQSISDAIISTAKQSKSDIIVVNAKIGSIVAGLGGSISRQVIRKSTCPVWVQK